MSAPVVLDMACEMVASAPGTGAIPLGGAPPAGGVTTFLEAGAQDGQPYYYYIQDGNNREYAWGNYSASGNSLGRNTVFASVNGVYQTTPINATTSAFITSIISQKSLQTSISSAQKGGFVNRLRNGTMDVWQRGASMTATTAGNYTADGWIVLPTGASVPVAQAAGLGPTLYALQATGATGVTDIIVKQRLESSLASALTAQAVTFQAQIYNNTGAAITPTLTVKHANSADNWTASTTDVNAVALQSCPNGAWTQVTYSFTDAGFANNGLEVTIDFGNNFGSSGQSIKITECDIRAANSAANPELRDVNTELKLCQRYFQTTYGNGIALGTATNNGMVSVSKLMNSVSFAAQMRSAPTLNFWDGGGNASKVSLLGDKPTPSVVGTVIGGSGNQSIALSQNIEAGDLIIVYVVSSGNPSAISDGTNTYSFVTGSTYAWYTASASPINYPVLSVTVTGGVDVVVVRVPLTTASPIDKTVNGTGSISSGTLSQAAEFAIGVCQNGSGNNAIPGADSAHGWTSLSAFDDTTNNWALLVEYQITATTTSLTFAPSGTVSEDSLITFKASPGVFVNGYSTSLGSLSLATSVSGFVCGLSNGNSIGRALYFHYSASAEL